jgi:tRNA threonylcarbamoyl adenosine modification protein YeaZ
MILAINTAQSVHELALIDKISEDDLGEAEILTEKEWQASNDDLEKLVPTLDTMLNETGTPKEEITEVLVVNGPGPFTALRTGIAFANALAHSLNTKLFEISTFDLLMLKVATKHPLLVVLNAGGGEIAVESYEAANLTDGKIREGDLKIGKITEVLAAFEEGKYQVVTEVTEGQTEELSAFVKSKNWDEITGHKLQTLGEMILTFGFKNLTSTNQAEVIYLRDPVITKSQDPWKNPDLNKKS